MPYMQATMNEFHRRASIGELVSESDDAMCNTQMRLLFIKLCYGFQLFM